MFYHQKILRQKLLALKNLNVFDCLVICSKNFGSKKECYLTVTNVYKVLLNRFRIREQLLKNVDKLRKIYLDISVESL